MRSRPKRRVATRHRQGTHRHRRPAAPRRLHGLRLEALELRLALAADTDAVAAIPVDSYVPGHVLIKVRQQPAILASPLSGLEGSGFTASAMALGTPIPASVTSVLAGHGAGVGSPARSTHPPISMRCWQHYEPMAASRPRSPTICFG